MVKQFKKVPLEDIPMVYRIYCQIEKTVETKEQINRAMEIYKNDILSRGSYTYACYVNEIIVGVVNVYKNWQMYPTDQEKPFVHLECIMVSPKYQNCGIGTELITNVVKLVTKEGCTYIIGQSPVMAMQKVFYSAGLTEQDCKDFRKSVF